MEEEPTPKVITEEVEARKHFQELKAAGFEIFATSRPLTSEEFVALALVGGTEVVVRPVNDIGGTGGQEESATVSQMEEFTAADVYLRIKKAGLAIFLIQREVGEDEFVQLAASRGRVDLRRMRPSGGVFVSYGSEIGFSRLASRTIVLPKGSDYVM